MATLHREMHKLMRLNQIQTQFDDRLEEIQSLVVDRNQLIENYED